MPFTIQSPFAAGWERRRAPNAFTFLEVMGAIMVVALFFGAVFYSNSRAISMLRAAKESHTATRILQERTEQFRGASWAELIDSDYTLDVFSSSTAAGLGLSNETEKVTISRFPAVSGSATIQVSRAVNGATTLISDATDFYTETALRVDLRVTWTGAPNGKTHTKETSMIIANGGLGL